MDDCAIIALYEQRSEQAIAETDRKYGPYCTGIAYRVLASLEDAEECVSDTWLRTWQAIPPAKPGNLRAFVGRITHNLALNRYRFQRAQKRSVLTEVLEEFEIPVLVAAAIVAVLAVSAVAVVYHYTHSADTLEEEWNSLSESPMTEEQKTYVESRSANIGQSVTNQGITVTVDSVTCTEDTVYLLYTVIPDPEAYDEIENLFGLSLAGTYQVENPAYGASTPTQHSSGGSSRTGVYQVSDQLEFEDLPQNAPLGDGATTMQVELTGIHFSRDVYSDTGVSIGSFAVSGSWSFAFPLPESTSAQAVAIQQTASFTAIQNLEVSQIVLTESGVSFTAVFETDDYAFAVDGIEAELARAAQPAFTILTVSAQLSDGSTIPSGHGHATGDGQGAEFWTIDWAAPVDPATVTALVFSDGVNQVEVPVP